MENADDLDIKSTLYVNENGSIELIQINDTIMRTIFENNTGDRFDTTMKIIHDFRLIREKDSLPFLSLGMRGIQMHASHLQVYEFSSMLFLDQFIRIENLYTRPFFKTGEEIALSGVFTNGKGGQTLGGIYLNEPQKARHGDHYVATGYLTKETYPLAYYSTDESPQGMFGDTSEVHYRLVIKNVTLEKPENTTYTGSVLTDENGVKWFIWDFADSEAYRLGKSDDLIKVENGMKITIEGFLVQDHQGSILYNWKLSE